jgi:hypothetical protein
MQTSVRPCWHSAILVLVLRPLLGAAALALLAGCAQPTALVARTGHHRLTARDTPSGVTVIVTTDVWNGKPGNLDDELTVVHVLVANMGKEPILLAPGDIELRDLRGFRYDLLDTGATFYLAGERAPSGAYGRAYLQDYDPGRSDGYMFMQSLGTMAEKALPWGVLEPGTQMRGFLYFERIEASANGGKLVWHLETPEHKPVVDAQFDLFVARG